MLALRGFVNGASSENDWIPKDTMRATAQAAEQKIQTFRKAETRTPTSTDISPSSDRSAKMWSSSEDAALRNAPPDPSSLCVTS
jgi:hypothetical protein